MILCEWDALEGNPGQYCVHLYAFYLMTSFTSVSIFAVCCYSSVSISVVMLIPNIKKIGVPARHAACVAIGKGEGDSRGDSFGQ
jgi:hypothetical protein